MATYETLLKIYKKKIKEKLKKKNCSTTTNNI